MSIQNEGTPAPESLEGKAIAALEKEGHIVEGKQPPEDNNPIKETKEEVKEEAPKEETPKEESRPARIPTMVEAWKLQVANDNNRKLQEQLREYTELNKQKSTVDVENRKEEITDDIEAVIKEAEALGTDGTILRKLANSIINKTKPSENLAKTLSSIQEERELEKQLNAYQTEFDTDVAPLVKGYNLSDTALLQLREQLKDYAFSETYAKVPLKEIFRIKEDGLGLKTPKRSSESKGVKVRASEVVDLESIDEDSFKNLSPKQIEEFVSSKTSNSGWNRNKK